uniref:NADPH--hemoprotein reductase n=1 Tax=Hemiselmis andersenii TaxID=464988 RepID=A0A6U2DI80_HEMAN|mmetsp:Transcript_24703/g.57266  ORF Transcript_24703/g.57266 Transcript_24703/m.57266 type:complete len:628 (+) Transcript_24703:1-1884(+)
MGFVVPAVGVGLAAAIGIAAYSYSVGASKEKAKKSSTPSKPTGPKVDVYFGSQTGTAEEFAKSLAKEGIKRNFDMRAVDLERFEGDDMPGQAAIFLVATYGEGDPTDNAKASYEWMKSEAKQGALEDMSFAVFGLGNTQYEHYNSVGKFYDSQCETLGGKRIVELGLGDDDQDIQEDFNNWLELLWPALDAHFGLESHDVADSGGVEYRLQVETYPTEKAARKLCGAGGVASSSAIDHQATVGMTVTCNRELYSPEAGRSCRHVELDIAGVDSDYITGDHVAILSDNNPELVASLARRVGADLDEWVVARDEAGAAPFPCPCTVRHALTRYLDLNGALKRRQVAALAEAAGDGAERERLERLASKEGKDELHEYAVDGRRNILDVMRDFPSVDLKLSQLVELLPRAQPRYYSISSSNLTHPSSVHVTAVVVRDEMPDGRVFGGVCTTYLNGLPVGSRVTAFCRRTTFKLPSDPSTPVVMIGAGTGLAPMRGMYLHLDRLRSEGAGMGENMLVFGCRTSKDDFLYSDEIRSMVDKGTLSHLVTAFSREVPGQRPYVQHRVRERAADIIRLLDGGAHLYVCGLTAMAKDVKRSLSQGLEELKGMKGAEAEAYLERLHSEGRYMQDVWSS